MGLELEELGLAPKVILGHQTSLWLVYGGASRFARACVAWTLGHHDLRLDEEHGFSCDDNDLWLYVSDPAAAGRSPQERYPVQVRTDGPDGVASLVTALTQAGFQAQVVALPWETAKSVGLLEAKYGEAPRFALCAGPFESAQGGHWTKRLHDLLERFLGARDLGPARFPVEFREAPGLAAILDVPLRAVAQGALRAYGSECLDVFRVDVQTDDEELTGLVVVRLPSLGLREGLVRPLRDVASLRLRCPSGVAYVPALKRLRQQIDAAAGHALSPSTAPVELRYVDLSLEQLSLYLPLRALREGTPARHRGQFGTDRAAQGPPTIRHARNSGAPLPEKSPQPASTDVHPTRGVMRHGAHAYVE